MQTASCDCVREGDCTTAAQAIAQVLQSFKKTGHGTALFWAEVQGLYKHSGCERCHWQARLV